MINTIIGLIFTFYLSFLPDFINSNSDYIKNEKRNFLTENQSAKNTLKLYQDVDNKNINFNVFENAIKGYSQLLKNGDLTNENLLSIIDFSKSANEKRFFILDLKNKKTVFEEYVAHGTKSGVVFATKFSNNKHSNQSSLGFYVTGKTYKGKNGFSLKLHGKEKDFNSNAYERGVVIHGANYVSEKFIKQNGRLGRSFGCPAINENIKFEIIEQIKNGTCLFIYYPDKEYISKSKFLNSKVKSSFI